MQDLQRRFRIAMEYFRADVKKDIGIQATNFYRKAFRDEGFTDRGLTKWQAVKRATTGTGAAAGRKILTGETKQLSDSIAYRPTASGIVITTGVKYAKIHNEGGMAGRNKTARIPKRQFIGKSEVLFKILQRTISAELTRRLNR